MPKPLVSVILPTHNRAHTLLAAMASVLNQTHSDLELIVIDDASEDGTEQLVGAWSDERIVYHSLPKNVGVAAARNVGISLARGHYLAFQDSDDEWLLNKLEVQIRALRETHGRVHANLCGIMRYQSGLLYDALAEISYDQVVLTHADALIAYRSYTQTLLVERALFDDLGGFDASMGVWEDWELLIRLSQHTEIGVVRHRLVLSTQLADSLSVVDSGWIASLEHILKKHAVGLQGWPRQHAQLRYILARLYTKRHDWIQARRQLVLSLRRDLLRLRPWLLLGLVWFPRLARRVLPDLR